MDVTDVLRDRMQQPAGLQRMVSLSLLAHAAVIGVVLFAPQGLLTHRAEAPRSVMTISLGGSATSGPQNGGLTAIGGRPVQVQTPPDEPPKREAERPPAAKAPGMTTPVVSAKPARMKAATPLVKATDEARGRTPTQGPEVREGSAVAETGARGKGFGLSTGGSPGSGATVDFADFCCPEYLVQLNERILSTWDQQAGSSAAVIVRFTIERDGKITDVGIKKSSGNDALDIAARRAVIIAKQLPPLPAQYPNAALTVNLIFQYQR
jgi:TonB family protein